MDSLTSFRSRTVTATDAELLIEEHAIFFEAGAVHAGAFDGLNGGPSGSIKRRDPGRRYRGLALLAGAAGAVAVLGYVIIPRSVSHRSSVTTRLPSPTQSAAAVTALPPPNLLKPVTPEEATKENADRPFVARPDTPASRFVIRTDADDRTRALTCLAQAVYYEAAGEGTDGGRAVAQVVLNRVRHPGFPSTICGVVYQGSDRPTGCQFSFTCDGSMQRIPIPWLWTRSKQIADEALKGHVFAGVGHATHYHADYVLPYWADSLDKSVQIGRHIFYRLRSSLGDARGFSQHYGGTEPPFRVPGAAVMIPATTETQQLANALISDGVQGPTKPAVEKASAQPSSPLLIDAGHATLLADAGTTAPQPPKHKKQSAQCSRPADRSQFSPLRADDMRSTTSDSGC